ncbi:RNA polymerase sigma-70 factor [Burkholderia cenocepacia]|uniref:RNA polymerase sigma-70 factor n=1 Tax=Burkholderia TaxID=32008 RepID=UPI000B7A14FF|nr:MULTISPECIES: RNA polymerase sigma-70 factor [unclassified Burkholderia]RQU76561.1 RNA polymerase sigma-70 factor [Burkholderia cenocepacia]OXI68932.1 RNA polymerase subunit sigma-24 [Burkholderia sp. AU31280]QVN13827.1 RNA polymerase sigma-70 factor [Burkholderia sp. LAS2]RQV59125.1 RNA polymerase sigma-70 factor [Burkholderia cenocepacia]RQZ95735.1 RNA polymerase sigma-70 factor [Burkholderia cenocepacia]
MSDDAQIFHTLRPRLQKIAYRMLGSIADAEDIVQDVWLRWHDAARDGIENAEAWLVAVTTRTSIDRLRAAKIRREHYTGIWLPEPELGESPATPEEMTERANDVSVAYLLLLERLTPEARAAFLLREVFDADYDEIADAIGKSEAACRQLVSRAKAQLRDDDRPRHIVPRETHRQLLQTFSHALAQGDFPSIQALLAEDAMLIGDGGGKVQSFPKPMVGGRRIAQLFYATWLRCGSGVEMRPVVLNGEWAMLRIIAGQLESAMAFETDGTRIVRILVQRNPDKLARIAAACSAG